MIVEYDTRWPLHFEEERKKILQSIGPFVLAVEHIGSTSIPNLAAKPLIDILIVVPKLSVVEKGVRPLEALGYEYKGEFGIPGRHFFRKPLTRPRKYHIHMVELGSEEEWKHLAFRDYLRVHPEDAAQYAALKRGLANTFKADVDSYTEGKTPFIAGILQKIRREQDTRAR